MNTKEESTQLSTATQFTQADIPGMLETVVKKIKLLKKGVEDKPQTTEQLDGFGKINDIKDVDTLIKAYSSVTNRQKCYDEAAKEMLPEGVKKPVFKLNGFSADQWLADIKKRTVEVGFQQELAKLNKVKTKLEANLSAEAKLAKDLKDIANILVD
jgi:uncharacterized protein (DUF885 family)